LSMPTTTKKTWLFVTVLSVIVIVR
jgi:hypothetical protein